MFLSHLAGAYFDRLNIDGTKYYLYEEVWTDYAADFLTKVFLFFALALIAAFIGTGIFIKFKKPKALSGFLKIAASITIGFVITVIVAML